MKEKARASRFMLRGKKVKTNRETRHEETPRDRIVVSAGRFANGDVECKGWNDRIDRSVCIVRGIRHPDKCAGCALNL